jgi:hypothetical protein
MAIDLNGISLKFIKLILPLILPCITHILNTTQKSMSQILRLWYVESMKIVILYQRMSFCFDSTTLIIDFTSLVYFI